MSFGSQTVSFVTATGNGVFDEYGIEGTTDVDVPVTGCRHRPLRADEVPISLGEVATQIWKTTAPPEAAAIAAKSSGTLKEGGRTFFIVGGAQPFEDFSDPFKCTILSKIQTV
jgi:hypothetical protein